MPTGAQAGPLVGYPPHMQTRAPGPVDTGRPPVYHERLTMPWWWWPLSLGVTAIAFAPLAIALPGPGIALLAVPMAAMAACLAWLGRIPVTVTEDELRVDDARLPLRYVADAIPLDASARRDLLGPHADPLAFVIQRPWIPGAVQVVLNDPADPTPYWVISSRHPERLAAALRRG